MEQIDTSPMPKGRVLRPVTHPDDLKGLSVMPLMHPNPRGRLVLQDKSLPDEVRSRWEKDLNRAYAACGCGEASLGLVVGLLAALIFIATQVLSGIPLTGWHGLWLFLAVAIGQGLGKFAGLVRAQSRLARLVVEIGRDWRAEPRAHSHDACG
jgi:hypothetical protein